MKTYKPISTEVLSVIPLEGEIGSGYITYLLAQITESDVENSSFDLEEVDPEKQVLSKLLRNIVEGKNDKKTLDGVYLVEVGGHFVMLNLQDQDGLVKYKVFDSLAHTPNGARRFKMLTDILTNRFGVDGVSQAESDYLKVQQGVNINARDTDNCGLLCVFAQLVDEEKLALNELSSDDVRYHKLNENLNRLRGGNIQSVSINAFSQELLGHFTGSQNSQSFPITPSSKSDNLRETISNIFKKYESEETKSKPLSENRAADLRRLQQLSHFLSGITDKEKITADLLNRIGEETAKIIVSNSSKNNFIRNRYGLIGSKSDFTTTDGIEFMGLQALRYIKEADLDAAKMDDLFQGLKITKQKIDFAIREERGKKPYSTAISNFKKSLNNQDDLLKFSKFTREFYSNFLLKKMENEVKIFGKIDCSQASLSKEDKYLASRIFAKIGERAKELIDHNKDSTEFSEQQLQIFKFLKDVRDEINHNSLALISKELSGQSLQEIVEVIEDGLENGIDESKQEKIDKFLQIFQRSASIKTTTKAAAPRDPFLEQADALVDKVTKYCKLEAEIKELEAFAFSDKKRLLEKEWAEKVAPLDAEKDALYGIEIKSLEDGMRNLLIENQELESLEKKLAEALAKKPTLEKEIEAHKKNHKKHDDSRLLSEKTGLSDKEIARLKGSYKAQSLAEAIEKINAALESEQNLINEKTAELAGFEEFIKATREDPNFIELTRLKQEIKDEKKKNQPLLQDVNNRRKQVDEEMGGKIKAANEQIFKTEQKAKELESIREAISALASEISPTTNNLDKILNEDFVQEIKEAVNEEKSRQQKSGEEELDSTILSKKICKKLDKITEEMSYLHQIYSDKSLDPAKRSHVLQQSFSIVAQYSRDIEDLEKNSSFDSMQSVTKNAATFNESWRNTIRTRNKEISHDLDSFNEDNFFRTVRQDTLSMQQDLMAIRELLTFDYNKSKSENTKNVFDYTFGMLLDNAAFNHVRLGNYDKAEKCFEEALEYFDHSRITEKLGENNPNLLVIINEDSKFLERKAMLLENFAEVFIRTQRYDKALALLEQAEDLQIRNTGSATKTLLSNQAFLLNSLGRSQEAKEKIKVAPHGSGKDSDALVLQDIILHDVDSAEAKRRLDEMISATTDLQARFSALSHRAFIGAKEQEFNESKSAIKIMEDYLKENEGALKGELGNQFLELRKQLLDARIGRLGLKFRSEGDEVLNEKLLTKDDISDLKEISADIVKFHANKAKIRLSENAIHNFSCALSNVAVVLQTLDPKTSIDLLEKALSFQRDYKLDTSITIFQLGSSYHALSKTENKEANQTKSFEHLEAARKMATSPSTSACTYDTIASIHKENGNYRLALDNYRIAKQKWPQDPKGQDVDRDIEFCSNKVRVYEAAGSVLLKSYGQFKKSKGSSQSRILQVNKTDLQGYIKSELGVEVTLTETNGGGTIVKFNEILTKALEEKLRNRNNAQKR